MGLIFGIDIQRTVFYLLCLGQGEKLLHSKRRKIFNIHKKTDEQKATIGTVKLTLKIPP